MALLVTVTEAQNAPCLLSLAAKATTGDRRYGLLSKALQHGVYGPLEGGSGIRPDDCRDSTQGREVRHLASAETIGV